jgi:hypothetical protein
MSHLPNQSYSQATRTKTMMNTSNITTYRTPSLSLPPSKYKTTNLSRISHNISKKPEATSLLGKLPFPSLDHSHQTTVIWLMHGLRRTRRDLNSGFITEGGNHWRECKPLHHSADYVVRGIGMNIKVSEGGVAVSLGWTFTVRSRS